MDSTADLLSASFLTETTLYLFSPSVTSSGMTASVSSGFSIAMISTSVGEIFWYSKIPSFTLSLCEAASEDVSDEVSAGLDSELSVE